MAEEVEFRVCYEDRGQEMLAGEFGGTASQWIRAVEAWNGCREDGFKAWIEMREVTPWGICVSPSDDVAPLRPSPRCRRSMLRNVIR